MVVKCANVLKSYNPSAHPFDARAHVWREKLTGGVHIASVPHVKIKIALISASTDIQRTRKAALHVNAKNLVLAQK